LSCSRENRPGLCLLALLFAVWCAAGAAAQTGAPKILTIDSLGKGTAALDGEWQFHLGDDASFAAPGIDDATGHNGWEQITADTPWGAQGHRSYVGYAWYRRHVTLSPAAGGPGEFSLYIAHIEDTYEIYWNGRLVGVNGKMPPHPVYFYSQDPQTFKLGRMREGVLAFRVWKGPLTSFDSGEQGGFYAPPVVGSAAAIADHLAAANYRWLHRLQYRFGLTSLYGLLMVLCFLGWLRDRSQRVLLWMAVYCTAPLGLMFFAGLRLPIPYRFALGWLQPLLSCGDIGLWMLLLWLLKLNEWPRLAHFTRVLAGTAFSVASVDGLLTLLDWSDPRITHWVQLGDGVCTVFTTTVEAYPLVLLAFALRQRLDIARWLVAVCAFFAAMTETLRIALEQGSRFTHWTIADKIALPLFSINGNAFTAEAIFDTMLLLSIIYAVYSYIRERWARQQAVEQELKSARELQQVLIPEALPSISGYAVTSAYRPAQEVGGDFFQVISPRESGRDSTLIVLGDVSGKGLRAAMTVSLIVGTIRTLAEFSMEPAEILAGLNRRLVGRLYGGFATCVVMRLDADGRCTMANAGHTSPFLNEREIELPGALPLGLSEETMYEETTRHFDLQVGDHLLLYTDGLLEARTAAGELYSFDRLRDLVATKPNAEQATMAAQNFGQDDDITVLTLTRLAAGEESPMRLSVGSMSPELAMA
jgi:hypothetical protein